MEDGQPDLQMTEGLMLQTTDFGGSESSMFSSRLDF